MKKNKYLVFVSIGVELITIILIAVWLGEYLVRQGYPKYLQAFLVLLGFLAWFISLIVKLKNMKND